MLFGKRFRQNKKQAKPKKPQQPGSGNGAQPDSVLRSPWEAQNQDTLDQLARFVNFAEGFTIGFVEISFTDDVEAVVKALQRHSDCREIQFHVLDASDPNLRHLKDFVVNAVWQLKPLMAMRSSHKPVLVIRGLESAIGMLEDYPPVLQDLNFVRDAFIESVPHPILFCLPSYAINRIIRFAPDFWSWKSGTFRILSSSDSQDQASIRALYANKMLGKLNQLERQERVQLLECLAQEFSSLESTRSKEDLRIEAKALLELGILHAFAGEYPKVREGLEKAAQVLAKPNWQPETQQDLSLRINYLNWHGFLELETGNPNQSETDLQTALVLNQANQSTESALLLRGVTYRLLGDIRNHLGLVEEALTLYQKSLEIGERIDNFTGKAMALRSIAGIKTDRGELEAALTLYQKSLEIDERIDNFKDKAITLRGIAEIQANRGELEAALTSYQKSLEIDERIDNLEGKAITWRRVARIKAARGEAEEAVALYKQSLEIDERIDNFEGKAITLRGIAKIKTDRGEVEEALDLYQKSLEICEQIGNLKGKAVTLLGIGKARTKLGHWQEAVDLYQNSLSMMQSIKNLYGESLARLYIGFAQCSLGDYQTSLVNNKEALDFFQSMGYRPNEVEALKNLAEVYQSLGDIEVARQYAQQASVLATELGIPLKAECEALVAELDKVEQLL
jgi:tetratricopeptide (TPR) repeat protein